MKGRRWTAEEKLAIVLEGIKGTKPVAEICREHQIAQTQYYQCQEDKRGHPLAGSGQVGARILLF